MMLCSVRGCHKETTGNQLLVMTWVTHHREAQQRQIGVAPSETSTCSKHGSGRMSQVPASPRATRDGILSHLPKRICLGAV